MKLSTPPVISKSPASVPVSRQEMSEPSGSVAVYVPTVLSAPSALVTAAEPDTTGFSFTPVTVTVTSNVPVLLLPSEASTVTEYTLSVSESAGDSKFGDDAKVNTPVVLISKSAASVPDNDQVIVSSSGSVAV